MDFKHCGHVDRLEDFAKFSMNISWSLTNFRLSSNQSGRHLFKTKVTYGVNRLQVLQM